MPSSSASTSSAPAEDSSPLLAAHVRVKPPAFDEGSASRWFQILESQFIIAKITTSTTKFHHALSNLPLNVMNQLDDALINSADYQTLKDKIIQLYTKPAPELFDNIVSQHQLICQKPSVYLNELKKIAVQSNLGLSDEFLKIKFLKGLPDSVRPILATHNSASLDELARVADTLMAYSPAQPNISQISHSNHNSPRAPDRYAGYSNPNYHNGPYRSTSSPHINYNNPTIPINVRSFNHKQRPHVCRFHLYYGPNARSCKPWCMLSSTSSNILPSSRSSSPAPNRQSGN